MSIPINFKEYSKIPKERMEMLEKEAEKLNAPVDILTYYTPPSELVEIKINYLDETIQKLEYIGGHKSDWIDLRAAETVELKQFEYRRIHLGVQMQLPEGYEAHIVPRSSTFENYGIIQTNHQAVIDETYNGPDDWWLLPVLAMRDTIIEKGDRICQFRIMEHQPQILFTEEKSTNENRGGYGTSGKN